VFTLFISAFILGIVSSLHCIGMCGPIALAIPLNRNSKLEAFIGVIEYNFGRILIYSTLGFIVGFIGLGIQLIGFLQALSIISGCIIIIYAWRKQLNRIFPFFESSNNFIYKFTSKKMGDLFKSKSPFRLFVLGVLNGLLPCGMVYSALMTSIIANSPLNAGLTLFFFGLGTLPTMVVFSFYAHRISPIFKSKINRFLPYIVTVIGLMILLRGLNLNIPYLSPKVNFNKQTNEVNIEDCHKPYNK
jgi:hypothetical protein